MFTDFAKVFHENISANLSEKDEKRKQIVKKELICLAGVVGSIFFPSWGLLLAPLQCLQDSFL